MPSGRGPKSTLAPHSRAGTQRRSFFALTGCPGFCQTGCREGEFSEAAPRGAGLETENFKIPPSHRPVQPKPLPQPSAAQTHLATI